jgi:hypothetical protein
VIGRQSGIGEGLKYKYKHKYKYNHSFHFSRNIPGIADLNEKSDFSVAPGTPLPTRCANVNSEHDSGAWLTEGKNASEPRQSNGAPSIGSISPRTSGGAFALTQRQLSAVVPSVVRRGDDVTVCAGTQVTNSRFELNDALTTVGCPLLSADSDSATAAASASPAITCDAKRDATRPRSRT